jgi:hypothetical protein
MNVPLGSEGYLYVIKLCDEFYKIGCTTDAVSRLRGFNKQFPWVPELVIVIEIANVRSVEAFLHSTFKSQRVNGEWFKLSPEDVSFIKSHLSQ